MSKIVHQLQKQSQNFGEYVLAVFFKPKKVYVLSCYIVLFSKMGQLFPLKWFSSSVLIVIKILGEIWKVKTPPKINSLKTDLMQVKRQKRQVNSTHQHSLIAFNVSLTLHISFHFSVATDPSFLLLLSLLIPR